MKIIKENSNEYLNLTELKLSNGLYKILVSFEGFSRGSVSVDFEVFNKVIKVNEDFLKDDEYDLGLSDNEIVCNYVDNLTEGGEEYLIIKVDEYNLSQLY